MNLAHEDADEGLKALMLSTRDEMLVHASPDRLFGTGGTVGRS